MAHPQVINSYDRIDRSELEADRLRPERVMKELDKALDQENFDAVEKLLVRASKIKNYFLNDKIKFKLLTIENCEDDDKYVLLLLNYLKLDKNKLWDRLKIALIKRDVSDVKSVISLIEEDIKTLKFQKKTNRWPMMLLVIGKLINGKKF